MSVASPPQQTGLRISDVLVLLFVASLPFGGYVSVAGLGGNLGFPVLNVIFLITAAIGAFLHARDNMRFTALQQWLLAGFAILFGWQAISAFLNPGFAVYFFLRNGSYLAIIAVIVTYVNSRRELWLVLIVGFSTAVIASVLTIISSVFYIEIGMRIISSRSIGGRSIPFARTIGVPLTFGGFGIYLLGTLPSFSLLYIKTRRRVLLLAIGVVALGIIVPQTRSTWVATIVAFGAIVTVIYLKGLQSTVGAERVLFYGVGLAAFCIMVFVANEAVSALIKVNSSTLWSRIAQYQASIKSIISHPFVGVGESNIREITPTGQQPHNAFLHMAASAGLPAGLLLLSLPAIVIIRGFRAALGGSETYHLLALGAFAAGTAIFIDAQFITSIGKVGWLWLAVAASFSRWLQES